MMKHPTVKSQISSLKPAVSWVAVTWAAHTLIVTLGYQRMYHVYSAHWPFPGYVEKVQVTRSVFRQDSAAGGGGHSSAPCGTCIRTFPAYLRDYTWLQMFSAAASWPMCLPISNVALTLGTQFIFNIWFYSFNKYSVQFSRSVVSDSFRPHEPQHARPPCPSQTPRVHPNPCPLSWWCHPTISSSVVPFSSCPQSFPASVSFQMS